MKDKWAGCSPSRTNRQRKYNNVVRLVFFPTCSSSVFLATWGQRKQVKDIADISWRLSWYGELVSKRLLNYESLWTVQITHCWLLVSHWTASLVKVLCSIYPAITVGGTDDVNRRGQRLQNHIQVLALLALKGNDRWHRGLITAICTVHLTLHPCSSSIWPAKVRDTPGTHLCNGSFKSGPSPHFLRLQL